MAAGDLSTQRFNRDEYLSLITAGPPLEIRMSMSSIQSFSGGSTDQNAAPHLVISTEAKRSGEISRRREEAPWWQKISRLSVSIESKAFTPHISRSPARDDHNIRQPIIICDKPKGAVKKNGNHFFTAPLPFEKTSCPAKSIKIKDLEIPISPQKGRPLIRAGSGFLS